MTIIKMNIKQKVILFTASTFALLSMSGFPGYPVTRFAWEGDDLPTVSKVAPSAPYGLVRRRWDMTMVYVYTDNGEDSTTGEQCWDAKVADTSTITYEGYELIYPQWTDMPSDLCQGKKDEWIAFRDDVYAHEGGHAANIQDWDGGKIFDGYEGKAYFESQIHIYSASGVGADDDEAKEEAKDETWDLVVAYMATDPQDEVDGIKNDFHTNRVDRPLYRNRNCDGTISL